MLVARFDREFWKYRWHPKAYPALRFEAAHFSQTLYLVAGALALRAFVTAFVNNGTVDAHLDLDRFREGALLVCGCGRPGPSPLHANFRSYVPPR